ncbi:hypothetical protein FB446DRAFT_808966 [Lentinula raphanica]|nr:hypothetical protein FB446DRAFT_808966 [Lentinula raphanica]
MEGLPPASPLLNAFEAEDFDMEGPASPFADNDGPASPAMELDDNDSDDNNEGESEVSEDIEAKDVFKAPKGKGKAKASLELPIHSSPRVRPSKASTTKIGPPVASRLVPKPTKRERDTSSPVVDEEMREPLPKKAKASMVLDKTSKETLPPQVAETVKVASLKGSKVAAESHELTAEPEAPLAHNDQDTHAHHVLFLTHPDFQVKTAFADLVEQDSGLKRRPEMQILRSSPWTLDEELKKLGAFLTAGGVSFSLENLGRFGHLVSRRLVHNDSDIAVSDPDLAPSLDCLLYQRVHVSGVLVRDVHSLTEPVQAHFIWSCNQICCRNFQKRYSLFQAVRNKPGVYLPNLVYLGGCLKWFNLAGYNFAHLVRDLKVAGLDANVVLSAWAKEHPNDKLSYNDATLLAMFFNWSSSCNLSAYLEKPEEIKKFQHFLKEHKLESSSDPSTSSAAVSAPVESPVEEPKKTYAAMHASNWDAEAAAKPDEPATLSQLRTHLVVVAKVGDSDRV